jgi:hypothetical protein
MRGARYVRLIPWTLRSGSQQFIYNWKLENNLDWIKETGGSTMECTGGKPEQRKKVYVVLRRYANKSRVKVFTQNIIGPVPMPRKSC